MACKSNFRRMINGRYVKIPCKWCMKCRIDRKNEWADRLLFECIGKDNIFLTLTYDDEHLPPNYSLSKKEIKQYIERYRIARKRAGDNSKWKYYFVGEYGDNFARPHYHAILTNSNCMKEVDRLEKLWGKGQIKATPPNNAAITYVLKYMTKQIHGQQAKEIYDENGLERPFAHASKGIGKQYILDHIEEMRALNGYWYKGQIRPLPEYYKNLLRIGEQGNPKKKIDKMKIKGYNQKYEEYIKALAYMEEKHIITNMRNRLIPIDDRYLINYRPTEAYTETTRKLVEEIDLTQRIEQEYIYDLFGGIYENKNLHP